MGRRRKKMFWRKRKMENKTINQTAAGSQTQGTHVQNQTNTKAYQYHMHRLCINNQYLPARLILSTGRYEDVRALVQVDRVDVLVPLHSVDGTVWDWGFRGTILYYPMPDFGVLPPDVLRRLIRHILMALERGKSVGVFCIGGHGRTGYVGACLLKHVRDDVEDPIDWIRSMYCEEAIETEEQIREVARYWGRKDLLKHKPVAKWFLIDDLLDEDYYDPIYGGAVWKDGQWNYLKEVTKLESVKTESTEEVNKQTKEVKSDQNGGAGIADDGRVVLDV